VPEAIVLGSGTSNGVPILGREYPPAFLANPKNHRMRSSLMLLGPTGNLLVDCTPELRLQVTREQIYNFDAVVITHAHADHIMGMDDLRSMCMKTGRPMPVYTLPQYEPDIRRTFPYAFGEVPAGLLVPRFDMRVMPEVLSVGGMEVHSFVVEHGKHAVIGLRVNDFAYITDVSAIPSLARQKLDGLDTLIIDAVRYRPHINHFHMEKAIEVAKEIGARQTFFTHLSDDYDHDKTNKELPASMELAYDRLRLQI